MLDGEVYVMDHFLSDDTVEKLRAMRFNNLKKINNLNTPPVMYDTKFDYDLLSDKTFRDLPERQMIFDQLAPLARDVYGVEMPTGKLHHMQYFYKQNDPSSEVAFDVHAEDVNIYGPFVFMLYLSNEDDGEIEFPDRENAKADWSQGFQDMMDNFPVRFSPRTISILPRINRCVVATSGIAHRVKRCRGYRPNISGWPFFKEERLKSLDSWDDYKDIQ